ncbi:MAG: hypothetical protein COW16_08660 [Sphingomonadales bacterium CG12_big_fil_rev_8_21_14_0_65_65_10]|jgi:hypothetical protein|uniref:hypothetical protein n=1 Tax=Blastomonas marina TaxID=1867408 RepID=UPI000CBD4755|nr:hypothetical protein [Blastomonas marina]PIW54968.1 MAG: hypothetical protein COW16_08660 [Sphingomonadales bacterium CG12_big_fil_rev_8_21_14_0_65_65_10]WPZ03172.1 hypothetical protein T8S45_10005 [Blastomonas marina]
MTDGPKSQEQRQAGLAPETHNDEQDDHRSQAQEVTEQAETLTEETRSPTESEKGPNKSGLMGDSTQDTIDHMRDMESSGRVDMDAYRGEPNHDDNVDKFGKDKKPDGLRGDGT